MKKIVLTLVMGVFAFGSSGFKAFDDTDEQECASQTWAIGDNMEDMGFDDSSIFTAMYFVYTNCINGNNYSIFILAK